MKKLLVVGAGGHARVVIDAARTSAAWNVCAILDDNSELWGRAIEGITVTGRIGDWPSWLNRTDALMVALGDNRLRREIQFAVTAAGLASAVVLHRAAVVATSASVGAGTVVMAGGIINSNAKIGLGVIVNTGATIDHDCDIGDWTHIGPGVALCGDVSVGKCTLLGVGVKVIPGVRIGDRCVVGAGSVVIRDVPDDTRVAGVPARPL